MKLSSPHYLLQAIVNAGIREVCICPGSRNSPLIMPLLEAEFIKKYYWYEERSAAFFALGRSRATKMPVAVITTSGTAAGELLPAAMEAYYTGVPLLLITADRPRRFRGTGAPQTAEQEKIFGIYTPFEQDMEHEESCRLGEWDKSGPAHVNICLEDWQHYSSNAPLIDRKDSGSIEKAAIKNTEALDHFFKQTHFPFVLVSTLASSEREAVVQFLLKVNAPIYLEAVSGLREDARLKKLQIKAGVDVWNLSAASNYPIDGVLRIGGIPIVRFWRDLEDRAGKLAQCSLSAQPFSGLSWGTHICCTLDSYLPSYAFKNMLKFGDFTRWIAADQCYAKNLQGLLEAEPACEMALFHALSKSIPKHSRIYLGNSLPIREWDMSATDEQRDYTVFASRGLNGIDGQLSTFFGLCNQNQENWGIFGDLTTLYDFPAAWILPKLAEMDIRIVVINNSGGKIFERIYKDPVFQHNHDYDFEHFAMMWKLPYERLTTISTFDPLPKSILLEVTPCPQATKRFWDAHDAIKQKLYA